MGNGCNMATDISILIENLKKNTYDDLFGGLYGNKQQIEKHKERYIRTLGAFADRYGDIPVEVFSAPGRSEICGNHTDHQKGRVLAASITLDAIAVVAKCDEPTIHVYSEGYGDIEVDLEDLEIKEAEYGTTKALIRGVAAAFADNKRMIGGFKAYATSDVLGGSGLSSSAAFEVLIGNIFSYLYNDGDVDSVDIAKYGQYAENAYFGKPCGLMDQMGCSVGGMIGIDFASRDDAETLSQPKYRKVEVDLDRFGYKLCIVDTKGSHANLTGEYAAVPSEMREVAKCLGAEVLGEASEEEFYGRLAELRTKVSDRAVLRAMHYYEENKRVDAQIAALAEGDFDEFLRLIKASGDSSYKYLQNVFATCDVANQGVSLGLALSEKLLGGRGASRVHGGGFAGTIQAFVPSDMADEYKKGIEALFGEGTCLMLGVRSVGGCKVL